MLKKVICVTATAVLAVAVTAGCGASGNGAVTSGASTHQYVHNGTFTEALSTSIGSFDPYTDASAYDSSYWAYDPLVNLTADGKLVSGLASKWSGTDTEATFVLQRGITCSDGTTLTATQVAADLRYLGKPSDGNDLYGFDTPTNPYTVTASNKTNVITVVSSKPYGFLVQTIGSAPIVCAKGLAHPSYLATHSDGTGPYTLTGVVSGNSLTFTVRKGYHWGPGGASTSAPGTPVKVVLRVISNQTTAANLLLAGELNSASLTGPDSERVNAQHYLYYSDPITIADALYNEAPGLPTANETVRRALTEALDRPEIVAVSTAGVVGGGPETAWDIAPPAVCTANIVGNLLPPYDPAGASKLLRQAGWIKGSNGILEKGGKPLSLTVAYVPVEFPTETPTVELMAQEWKAIGVKVTLSGESQGQLVQTNDDGNFDVEVANDDVSNPAQLVAFVSGPKAPLGQNYEDINNPQFNRLAAKAIQQSGSTACRTWTAAQRQLINRDDTVPISQTDGPTFLRGATAKNNGLAIPIPTSVKLFK